MVVVVLILTLVVFQSLAIGYDIALLKDQDDWSDFDPELLEIIEEE